MPLTPNHPRSDHPRRTFMFSETTFDRRFTTATRCGRARCRLSFRREMVPVCNPRCQNGAPIAPEELEHLPSCTSQHGPMPGASGSPQRDWRILMPWAVLATSCFSMLVEAALADSAWRCAALLCSGRDCLGRTGCAVHCGLAQSARLLSGLPREQGRISGRCRVSPTGLRGQANKLSQGWLRLNPSHEVTHLSKST